MKILFSVLCLNYGGAEKNLCIVANHMAELGNEVVICNFNTAPTVQNLNEKIRVVDIPHYSTKIVKRLQQLEFIRRLINKEHPDVVVSFLAYPNFLSIIAGKMTCTPLIMRLRVVVV